MFRGSALLLSGGIHAAIAFVLALSPEPSITATKTEPSFAVCFTEPPAQVEKEVVEVREENVQLSVVPSSRPQLWVPAFSQSERSQETAVSGEGAVPLTGNPKPVYPLQARQEGLEGVVWIAAQVNAKGHVVAVSIRRPRAHRCLENIALRTVKRWRFSRGRSLKIRTVLIPIKFSLKDEI